MIKVNKKNNIIEISGHAGYSDKGKDIVCAAVSGIVYTTINAIFSIDEKSIEVKDNEVMTIKIISNDEITNNLIDNMFKMLKDVQNDYPKNIIVKER